ncbi:beta-taxilin [Trichonephila inaurata madagascariensis]|uniref:Beta-taxilin n=1 Tax=Trichonephila inaurata madagascariensis TaxID=2747483 RepID=A0A8X6XNG8_9ARAC|nr:beta-taxilin [Trichonephila inaurata madagascariensis]
MESTQENKSCPETNKVSEPQETQIAEPVQELKENKDQPSEIKNEDSHLDDDDSLDDLYAIDAATSVLDETFSIDDPDLIIPDHINEGCRKIITMCSTTAQNIRKNITEVLNARQNVIITEVDPASELQESLNKKIADFEKVVSGCFESDNIVDSKSGNSSQSAIQDNTVDNVSIALEESKKTNDPEAKSAENTSGQDSSTVITSIKPLEAISNDTIGKNDGEISKSEENKKEMILETSVEGTKTSSASEFQSSDSLKEIFKNVAVLSEDEKLAKKQKNSVSSKKKGEKSIDQILKSLGNGTAEEKLQLLCKKHLEALEEYRLIEPRLKQLDRQITSQHREKEQLQADFNRMILAKSRLESLCREMQKQSKIVKEESLLRLKLEEEKRKELANKFQTTLNDISALMQENSKKNVQLREENTELATKLKSLVDNYEIWEQNMSKIVQQKELEAQLAKAKHAKVNLLLKQETEKFLREKQSLLRNLSELQKRCTLLTANELQLRTELANYTSKYEEFQDVLNNSSKVFSTFKEDMESTSKRIKKLEKQTGTYKQKWENSNNALLEMIAVKEKTDKDYSNAQQRIATLEKLCRALQAERAELRQQLDVQQSNSVSATNNDVPSITPETTETD